jgi:hypothetical protein
VPFADFLQAILVFAFATTCVVAVSKIVLAFINRRSVAPQLPAELMQRIERIEQIVETTAVEVERVSEAQRFTARVLSERVAPGGLPASHGHGRVITPH